MNDPSSTARARLTDLSRSKDTSRRTAWLLTIGGLALLILLAVALVDYWLVLPVLARAAASTVLAAFGLVGLVRLVRLVRHATPLKEAALDVEARVPAAGCTISTAAEYLTGERKITQEYEPELVNALQARAAQKLTTADVPYWAKILRPAALLAGVLLGLLLFTALASGGFTALKRAAVPWTKATYTSVEVKPGTVEIPVGRDLDITSTFSGRAPKEVKLHWKSPAETKWKDLVLTASAAGPSAGSTYQHQAKAVRDPFEYFVTGGDAASEHFQVNTYVPPEVTAWQIEVAYPNYTRRAPATQTSPEVTALRASVASFQITPSTKLAKARLRFEKLPPVELSVGPNGLWTGQVTISTNTDYWVELADSQGHRGGNEQPFHIKALPDKPPKVELLEPAKDLRADPTNTIALKMSAADDFGVEQMRIVYRKLGGPEQSLEVKREAETNGVVTGTASLNLADLQLKDYELVAYYAEAKDNNTLDGPGVGKSPVYFIEITDLESGQCLSQGNSPKVNLLAIQKQIIADTEVLNRRAPAEKFSELAAREKDATDFGQTYLEELSSAGAPAEAVSEMEAAVNDLRRATDALGKRERDTALPQEESALARFYQVLKLMPELENLPTAPQQAQQQQPQDPKLKVVLEAIKKQKKEQTDDREIAEALQEARRLQQSQSGLAQTGQSASQVTRPEGDAKQNNSDKSQSQQGNEQPNQAAASAGSGSKGEGQQEGKSPEGQGQSQQEQALAEQLAKQQEQIGKEAAELAEKLERLAGKDTRVGQNVPKTMSNAAGRMSAAAAAFKKSNVGSGVNYSLEGAYNLNAVVAMLEKILRDHGKFSDVSSEDYPKEYETAIAEYLKRLSYQQ
ncbi:MAG: hypothetical protein HZA90_27210 [Verrucomicrobia bacterium]|nr:hypothetical protein [Verrucomicrobiota bacterium]